MKYPLLFAAIWLFIMLLLGLAALAVDMYNSKAEGKKFTEFAILAAVDSVLWTAFYYFASN